jgi:hypothetical protein
MKATRWFLGGAFLLALAGCATPVVESLPSSPEGLVGVWDGRYRDRVSFNRWDLTVREVTADGRLTGTAYVRGECAQCNKDIPVTGTVTGVAGQESVELVLGGTLTASFKRSGPTMEGSGPNGATYTLRKMR